MVVLFVLGWKSSGRSVAAGGEFSLVPALAWMAKQRVAKSSRQRRRIVRRLVRKGLFDVVAMEVFS